MAIPYVWSDQHGEHVPGGEVWVGVRTPGTEVPERAERIRAALAGPEVAAIAHSDAQALALHDPEMVAWLRDAWPAWEADGMDVDADRVVPYLFPLPGLMGDVPVRTPARVASRTGRWLFDTMTLIGPGTYGAARAALDVALTAADLVIGGERAAYGLCRPPGHHATRDIMGGSCFFNNAAAAAVSLRDALGGPVAILDVDVHHGNGAQNLFWNDPSVLTGSVHADPATGWFPHYVGFADEVGDGSNRNVPLPPGTGDAAWLAALDGLIDWAGPVQALVVALGVDAGADDPEGPFAVTPDGFTEAGRRLGAMGLPTVVVQEGGYNLATIGGLVGAFLAGMESAL